MSLSVAALASVAVDGKWTFVSPQMKPVSGGPDFPSVRYSASAVVHKGKFVVTHGYHYDHAAHHPAWKSDAWTFDLSTRKWAKVHEGENSGAPSARYSASTVLFEGGLWMYGGDDGGHKYSMNNYVFNAHFTELWRLDLTTYQWRKAEYAGKLVPPKRALHGAAVVDGQMYVYGGLQHADTWRYNFATSKWKLLVPAPANTDTSATHPGAPRCSMRPPHPPRSARAS